MGETVFKLEREYRQSYRAIENFAELYHQINRCEADKIIVNVENTNNIAPGLLPLLAVLPNYGRIVKKNIVIRYHKQNDEMLKTLRDSGVLDYYGAEERLSPDTESILFCLSTDDGELATLVERIMKLAPVQFNPKSYSTMYSKLYEVFNNAKTHGKNALGTYTYGAIENGSFTFSVYDIGVGIQQNVNKFLDTEMDSQMAMEWALEGGHSTLVSDYPRGAGFSMLEEFVKRNDGKITLCSDDVVCVMHNGNRVFHRMKKKICGTLFIMNIKADSEYVYDLDRR